MGYSRRFWANVPLPPQPERRDNVAKRHLEPCVKEFYDEKLPSLLETMAAWIEKMSDYDRNLITDVVIHPESEYGQYEGIIYHQKLVIEKEVE